MVLFLKLRFRTSSKNSHNLNSRLYLLSPYCPNLTKKSPAACLVRTASSSGLLGFPSYSPQSISLILLSIITSAPETFIISLAVCSVRISGEEYILSISRGSLLTDLATWRKPASVSTEHRISLQDKTPLTLSTASPCRIKIIFTQVIPF